MTTIALIYSHKASTISNFVDCSSADICQAHRRDQFKVFRNCHCYLDKNNLYAPEEFCLITHYYKDVTIPFLNVFQVKFTNMKKWAVLGSRHFPGQIVIPSNDKRVPMIRDVYSGIVVLNTGFDESIRQIFFIRDQEHPGKS
ncbi:hypothetical protein RF11_09491 [Thelohanellus kitauei]|uniref:Uncharacterized protein n=1 Tax=Thelohanellus kitauei TaxID=669202 RepID=A0A0C2IY32_THEKT|nr:hypothetical protein RF11_09491 [Thelohanellus kitauei]